MSIDYDEERRWIILHRGAFAIVCNLGEDPVTVPVGGDVVLASEEPAVDESATLQGHSFVILRTVKR
jgi:maltooligosyltrehalose trehalohydrolase